MKHKISAVLAVLLLAVAVAVVVWAAFARPDRVESGLVGRGAHASASPSPSASPRPTPSPGPTLVVPTKRADPLHGTTYCQTAELLGIYAHQSYGLDPDLGVVAGRSFSKRLAVVGSAYRRLAVQATRTPDVGASAAASWRRLAEVVEAAHETLQVTGYDVQSQVMIVKLADVAKATRTHLPKATATLGAACGVTRESLGF